MDPLHQCEMVRPSAALVEELLFEVRDKRAILAFDVSLALGPIGNARSLFDSQHFAGVSQVPSDELATIIAGEQLRRPQRADEILKRLEDSVAGLVA